MMPGLGGGDVVRRFHCGGISDGKEEEEVADSGLFQEDIGQRVSLTV